MPQLESPADVQYQYQLPTVSYRVIDDDPSLNAPAGVHSVRHYGYNDFTDFSRPEHYIRYIEPIESELAVQVEYDMDEQDQAWLDAINTERKKDQSGPIPYEVFEIIMDKLEKEWFNLVKRIPQPASHMPVEDSKCAVCDDGEGENSNAIVFCDGCNLAVHQDCYGVPYIPEGQWLCRKCTVSPENPVSCLVCPNEGGAFKQTTSGHWAHLLCAIWIPELTLGNAIYMEPIDGAEAIPKNRWKLICSVCREKMGACVQCDNRNCFTAFHVTCARQMGYLMPMKSVHNDGSLKAFCDKHMPDEMRKDTFDDEFDPEHSTTTAPKKRRESRSGGAAVTTKTARAHTKAYRPGPPIVPHVIVQTLNEYVAKLAIRKKAGFMERLCRYWSLKREARRGAPLLKRLHLEPWTASNASRQQTEAEKALKLSFLRMLRNDLEKVRMLAEQVRKREREKLRQAQVIKEIVDGFIFPGYEHLRLTLEKISALDRTELFLHPVNRFEVPDYFTVIKEPMSWMQMDDKLEKNLYKDITSFKRDVDLVLDNAMIYNKADTTFHKAAKRMKTNVQPLLQELDSVVSQSTILPPDEEIDISAVPEEAIGDLEPSLLLLKSLLHTSTVVPEGDNLASVFLFEMTRPRPPTPTPPPSPPKEKEAKRNRWQERQAAAKDRIVPVPRATRSVVNANTAFAQEAGLAPSPSEEAHSRQSSGETKAPIRRSGRSSLLPAVEQALEVPKRIRPRKDLVSVEMPAEASSSVVLDTPKRIRPRKPPVLEAPVEASPAVVVETSRRARPRRTSPAIEIPAEASSSVTLQVPKRNRPTKASSSVGTPAEASSSETRSETRVRGRQIGVAAVETVPFVSDKERRQRELELDLVTEEVDGMDQFKRFNVGWVLPAGTKRKRPESSSGGMLGVPRGRTVTTSPLVPSVPLPSTPPAPVEEIVRRAAPPPPSSPLSDISSESLTPAESEDDEPGPSSKKPTALPVIADEIETEEPDTVDEPSVKATAKRNSKRKRQPRLSGRNRKRQRTSKAARVDDDMEVDEGESMVVDDAEGDMEVDGGAEEEEELEPVASAEVEEIAPAKMTEVESEDDLTPVPDELTPVPETEMEIDVPPAAPALSTPTPEPEPEPEPALPALPPPTPTTYSRRRTRRSEIVPATEPEPESEIAEPIVPPTSPPKTSRKRAGKKSAVEAEVVPDSEPVVEPTALAETPVKTDVASGSRKRNGRSRKSDPAPEPGPVPESETRPEPNPAHEHLPEAGPDPAVEPDLIEPEVPQAPKPAAGKRSGRRSRAAPDAEPIVEVELEAEREQEIEPDLEEADVASKPAATKRSGRKSKVALDAEPIVEVEIEAEREQEVEPEVEVEPEAEPEVVATETARLATKPSVRKRSARISKVEPEPEPEPEVMAEIGPEVGLDTEVDPEPILGNEPAPVEAPHAQSSTPKRRSARRSRAASVVIVEPQPESGSGVVEAEAAEAEEEEEMAVVDPIEEAEEEEEEEVAEGGLFPTGSFVWARVPSFPYFPAEVIDPYDDDVDIPEAVLDLQPETEEEEYHWLIRFFDSMRSYAWVKQGKMVMLGDAEVDRQYLAGKDGHRGKGFRTKAHKTAVIKAFQEVEVLKAAQSEEAEVE